MAEKNSKKKNPEGLSDEENALVVNQANFGSELKNLDSKLPRNITIDKDTLVDTTRKNMKKSKLKLPVDISNARRITAGIKEGLSSEQVALQMEQGYINVNQKKAGKTYTSIFLSNIFTFFNILTFIVAAAMIAVGVREFTKLFFLVIIFANIGIGIFQEVRAKRSVDRLKLVTAPSANVIRDGKTKSIAIEDIVLDDILQLEAGKQICADSIVLQGELEVNESMITGESIAVKKSKGDLIYSGSFVSSGTCYARVDKVGEANYIQTLSANAKKYRKPNSELNKTIISIMKFAAIFIVPITAVSLGLSYNQNHDWVTAITTTSGAVIGMIPAGMFLLTSVALFASVVRLANKKTLVQDLYCIEMLARVDTLCLDKTGTITDGSMTVHKVINFKHENQSASVETVIGSMLTATEDNNQTALALAEKFGYSTELVPDFVLPFSSQRKYSAVSFENSGTYLLGAPEYVLKDMGVRIEKLITEYITQGYRVVVLAHSPQVMKNSADKLPVSRKAVSMIIIEDHIRGDAVETIQWFKDNDVSVKVISGDNPITVSEVAKRVGVENAELYISLVGLSDQEVVEAADKYTVFGRVTPEQKSLLVHAMKVKGHTVAMTGDGVNDILAMREADCSIAIASGAEAARNVSHLVLLDNNFTSMPDIVLEGRKVVNNVQKSSSLFLMKTIMSMILSLIFINTTYPFQTNNLLMLEVFVIGIPSFFLALQPNKNRIEGKFLLNIIGRAIPGGLALILGVNAVYWYMQTIGGGIDNQAALYETMSVICISFTGFMVLCKICEPFNFYRTLLCIGTFLLMIAFIIFAGGSVGITKYDLGSDANRACFFFLIAVILISYFVVTLIMKILKRVNILFD